jgi:ASC-1-like (ASCH) protein
LECEKALCLICFATKHNGHKSAELEEVADGFRSEIRRNISQLGRSMYHLTDWLSTFRTKRQEIVDLFNKAEAELCSWTDELKSIIERHKRQLINQLTEAKAEKLKEIDTLVHDTTQNKTLIESLEKYSEELLKKGSDGDIARDVKLMNLRVEEMRQFYELESVKTIPTVFIKFVPSGTKLDTSCNTVGRLDIAGKNFINVLLWVMPLYCITREFNVPYLTYVNSKTRVHRY